MTGIELIAQERDRQVKVEGWTSEHDNQWENDELLFAAACYILPQLFDTYWPWHKNWWKPKNRKRDLIRAGALIAAELDRLSRIA